MLAVKAVLLNLVSLAAAFGIVVFIFQQGHGSSLWGLAATQSITAYIPVMIFAFLFGLSMDYEVFMLSRMREAYDETGSTDKAIELGLARTGKLVTSAALILMFAFLVLSSSPGYEVKSLAIGLAAGIIFDATVIRALLVPALMKLLGDANWWMPKWTGTVLRIPQPKPHLDMSKTLTRTRRLTRATERFCDGDRQFVISAPAGRRALAATQPRPDTGGNEPPTATAGGTVLPPPAPVTA